MITRDQPLLTAVRVLGSKALAFGILLGVKFYVVASLERLPPPLNRAVHRAAIVASGEGRP